MQTRSLLRHLLNLYFIHFNILLGEKPYPCQFCGRRFRTNYNKLGHEKKCPDRHAAAHDLTPASNSNAQNNVNSSSNNKNDHSNSGEPPQKIMLNLNNQAVPVSSGAGGGRPTNHSGSQSSAPPTAQTAEYRQRGQDVCICLQYLDWMQRQHIITLAQNELQTLHFQCKLYHS